MLFLLYSLTRFSQLQPPLPISLFSVSLNIISFWICGGSRALACMVTTQVMGSGLSSATTKQGPGPAHSPGAQVRKGNSADHFMMCPPDAAKMVLETMALGNGSKQTVKPLSKKLDS